MITQQGTGDKIRRLSEKWRKRDTAVNELQAKVVTGRFVWRINNFEKLFQQAMSGEVPAIYSSPFYSDIPGT